jgi:hypothetical protein
MASSGPGIRPRTLEMVRLSADNSKPDAQVVILARDYVDIVVGGLVRRRCVQCRRKLFLLLFPRWALTSNLRYGDLIR